MSEISYTTDRVAEYRKIIETEVLSGINRALHSIMLYESENPCHSGSSNHKLCEYMAEQLKERLPDYIDSQVKAITEFVPEKKVMF